MQPHELILMKFYYPLHCNFMKGRIISICRRLNVLRPQINATITFIFHSKRCSQTWKKKTWCPVSFRQSRTMILKRGNHLWPSGHFIFIEQFKAVCRFIATSTFDDQVYPFLIFLSLIHPNFSDLSISKKVPGESKTLILRNLLLQSKSASRNLIHNDLQSCKQLLKRCLNILIAFQECC